MSRKSAKRLKSSQPTLSAKKHKQLMDEIKEEVAQQVDAVVDQLQGRLNKPYLRGEMEHRLKYSADQAIIFLFEGWYYSGLVDKVYRMTDPASIYPKGKPKNIARRIPSYLFHFLDSPDTKELKKRSLELSDGMQNEICENEIVPRDMHDPDAAFGSLVCDLWNKTKKTIMIEKGLEAEVPTILTGLWLLDEENYKKHERLWQKQSGEKLGFEEYCSQLCSEEEE